MKKYKTAAKLRQLLKDKRQLQRDYIAARVDLTAEELHELNQTIAEIEQSLVRLGVLDA
jgi:hypothetical protein